MHALLMIIGFIFIFMWLNDNPGVLTRIVVLCTVLFTWFNVSSVLNKPVVSLPALIQATFEPMLWVAGIYIVFCWIKTGKI
jgi:hypothetical protein